MQRQRILFSAYRRDQYDDPESFMASLGMVFEDYPNEVICYVTDPRTGVQRHSKWPPTISEVVAALDNRAAGLKRQERYRNWGKNEPLMLEGPQAEKPTLEEMQAKYGKDWGLGAAKPEKPALTQEEITASWANTVKAYQANPSLIARLIASRT